MKTCLLIDIALSDDPNIYIKETEKLSQYKEPDIAVGWMWKVRTKTLPVTTGALGTIKKGLDQNLQLLPGHQSAKELQKVTLMNTAHSIHKVLWEITVISCWDLDLPGDHYLIINRQK